MADNRFQVTEPRQRFEHAFDERLADSEPARKLAAALCSLGGDDL
ncbi:MAG: hypothetical protein R6W80_17660 [Haliea sp.]